MKRELKRNAAGAPTPANAKAGCRAAIDGDDDGEWESKDFDPSGIPTIPAPPGVVPWPANAGDPSVARPSQFVFALEHVSQKERLKAASTFPCSTCEGSIDFDVWRRSFLHPHETYSPGQDRVKLGPGDFKGQMAAWDRLLGPDVIERGLADLHDRELT